MNIVSKIDRYLNKENVIEEMDDSNEVEFGYRSRRKKNAYLRYLLMLKKKSKKDPIKEQRDREALERYYNEPILQKDDEYNLEGILDEYRKIL